MRIAIALATAIMATTTFCGAALAQPAPTQNSGAPVAPVTDCRKSGNELSALIDNRTASPNLPAARAVFQVGIMECMEGDVVSADKYYQMAKELLANGAPLTVSPVERK